MCQIGSHCPATPLRVTAEKTPAAIWCLCRFYHRIVAYFAFLWKPGHGISDLQYLLPSIAHCGDDKYEFSLKTYNSCCCSCSPGSAQGGHGLGRWLPRVDDPGLKNKNKFWILSCVKDEEVISKTRVLSQNLFQIPAQKHEIHLLVQMCYEGLKIVRGSVSCASLMACSAACQFYGST